MSKVYHKSIEQIALIRESCQLVSKTLAEVAKIIAPGIPTIDLDKLARTFIKDFKGEPAFLNYNGFPYSLCISVNDQVVHGFPGKYVLREGDIVSVDCGALLNGYYGDSAFTFPVGEVAPETFKLLKVTRESLELGCAQALCNRTTGDIGHAVQKHAEGNGCSVVRELVGHGVGIRLHEGPEIPNYGKAGTGTRLTDGMVVAIEPMINLGKPGVKFWRDGWTVSTIDGKPSAHFEHTIAIHKDGMELLSTFDFIEEVLFTNIVN